jgi:hypothetical protein
MPGHIQVHSNILLSLKSFIGQFYFQNDIYKFQKVFPEIGVRVFIENGIGSFQAFLILQIRDKVEVL